MKKFTILFLMLLVAVAPTMAQDEGITVWLTGSDTDTAILQAASEAWTAESGIAVTVEALPWSDRTTRALAAISAGEGADIFIGGLTEEILLGAEGGLVALDEAFGDELTAVHEASYERMVTAIVGYDAPVYAVPYSQDTYLMYYYTPALEAAGVEVPTTWDEMTTVLSALGEAELGSGGYGWGNRGWLSFHNYLLQAGGSWYAEDCSAAAVNSDEGLVALEYYTMLFEEYGFPAEQADPGPDFAAGERSLVISGQWHASGIDASFPELEGDWGVAPLPTGPGDANTAFIGGRAAGIFDFSENQDVAWDFLQWLSTPEAGELLTVATWEQGGIYLPPYTASYEFIQGGDAFNEAVSTQLADAAGPPNCPGWEESQSAMNLIIEEVLAGADFEDALADMEDTLNEALAATDA